MDSWMDVGVMWGGARIEPERRDAGCGGSGPRYERLRPRSFAIRSKMSEWLSQYSNVATRFCLYARASSTSMIYDVRVKVYRCASIFIRAPMISETFPRGGGGVYPLPLVFTVLTLLVTHHLLSFLASSIIAIYHVSDASYTSSFS